MNNDFGKNTDRLANPDVARVGWLLVGGGVLGSIYLLIEKNRSVFSWVIPVGMIAAGIELFLKDHRKLVEQTGDQIMAQLDELDPITKAQVVKYLADQEIGRISG